MFSLDLLREILADLRNTNYSTKKFAYNRHQTTIKQLFFPRGDTIPILAEYLVNIEKKQWDRRISGKIFDERPDDQVITYVENYVADILTRVEEAKQTREDELITLQTSVSEQSWGLSLAKDKLQEWIKAIENTKGKPDDNVQIRLIMDE